MEIQDLFSAMPVLETPRTILRKIKTEDAPDLFEYSSNT